MDGHTMMDFNLNGFIVGSKNTVVIVTFCNFV